MTPEEFAKEIKVAAKAYIERSPDKAGVWFFIEEAEILIERWREIDPCPNCYKTLIPQKPTESLFVWQIQCCGLSATDPWFRDVIIKWADVVAMYGRVKP